MRGSKNFVIQRAVAGSKTAVESGGTNSSFSQSKNVKGWKAASTLV